MISPTEIRKKAERKYISYLQNKIKQLPFERIEINGDKSYSKSISEFEKEIIAIVSQSKEKKGFGYTIDYQTIKTKTNATQSLPTSIYFDSEKDYLKFLGVEKEVEAFEHDLQILLSSFPELKDWAIKNPNKIINNQSEWGSILKVCEYFKGNPKPTYYIRELPIQVHTKFIERNKTIIKELLDIIIELHVNKSETTFEKRFNLKDSEPLIRFRILDKGIALSYFSGLDDISIPVSQFEKLILPLEQVLIVENKTTLYTTLTLPKLPNTIAIFGSGYSVSNLKKVEWLKNVKIYYWGDIDAQGFEILSQVRGYFPNTKSILMDKEIFNSYFEGDKGTPSKIITKLNLNELEMELYKLVKENNWRLEQEKIPVEKVNEIFKF